MKKAVIASVVLLGLFLMLHQFYYTTQVEQLNKKIYHQASKELQSLFQEEVSKKQGRTASITYILSQDKIVIEALKTKNRKLLDYKELIQGIEKFSDYKNLWIQVIDKDGYSFYRSWTDKVGDHAATARVDIQEMINNPKPMKQVSTGRFDMTFKTMLPLYHNGVFIGMIELISHFNSIAVELKKKEIEPIFAVDKSYTKRFIKPFTGLFIEDNYIANLNASKPLMKKIEKYGIEHFLNIDDYLLFEDYLVTTDRINNIKNNPMGYFILFKKRDSIDMTLLQEFQVAYLEKISALMLIAILGLLLYLNRNYVKSLNKEVLEKTKKIKKQKENLSRLLNIYDKHVIFSKTDPNGIITHASEAFCKVSGYKKQELIGHSHNIIRHPDMTQDVFKYMWKELKSGNSVKLEVKNRTKDGGHYWVDAEIEPEYDKDGNLVGYVAVRDDITANKDIEEIQKEIIFTMGSIGESRSLETGNHVKRVAEYSEALALLYGLAKEEASILKQASPMHDIGKVAIPDSILKKPGKLTDQERVIMNTHVIKGYDMLKVSNRTLLKTAAIIALEHHEKWDGTGYPTGIQGENIHIYGRITAVADVFDALGSDRCYKKAWSDEEIFAFFKEQRGKHFDPKLVDIFFENLDIFLDIREKYKDSFE